MAKNVEVKFVGGSVKLASIETRNGVKIGIVEGYIATWDLDRGAWGIRDQFVKGAFAESIARHKETNRPIRLKDHHGRTIGGFPIDTVFEDDTGLFGRGEVNLEVQQGREAHSLALQGVLSDFSIGFSSLDDTTDNNIRTIKKAEIWEGSMVDEPMNPKANITDVKSMIEKSEISDEEKSALLALVEKISPDDVVGNEKTKISVEDLKSMDPRTLEKSLRDAGFSREASRLMVAKLKGDAGQSESDSNDEELKSVLADMGQKLDQHQETESTSQLQSMLEKVDNHGRRNQTAE
jgi:HK97 family phage prohead protease